MREGLGVYKSERKRERERERERKMREGGKKTKVRNCF